MAHELFEILKKGMLYHCAKYKYTKERTEQLINKAWRAYEHAKNFEAPRMRFEARQRRIERERRRAEFMKRAADIRPEDG